MCQEPLGGYKGKTLMVTSPHECLGFSVTGLELGFTARVLGLELFLGPWSESGLGFGFRVINSNKHE